MIVLKSKWFLPLPFFFFLSSFQKVSRSLESCLLDSPKTSHFRKCPLLPTTRPHIGRVCLLCKPASWEGRWQNLFEGEVTSLPTLLPPWRQEEQQLRQRKRGYRSAGELGHPAPRQLQVFRGDRKTCEDGNYTRSRRKDGGSRVSKILADVIGNKE